MTVDFVDWPAMTADGHPFPKAVPACQVADELLAMLISPDPKICDGFAYTAAARWIAEGRFDEVLGQLGDTAACRFAHPEVQARSFAPLTLCLILKRADSIPGLVTQAAAER
ncbi:hypothetical protein AB0B40_35690 [Streptomyces sp. NPDC042638]|uniref:hypothetical protein n=1 Tax=Streptomyces sp. NPDC042638 TaxID=3154333 RepID=UPI0033D70104